MQRQRPLLKQSSVSTMPSLLSMILRTTKVGNQPFSQSGSRLVVEGASHYELYHQPGPVGHALGILVLFFKQHLVAS